MRRGLLALLLLLACGAPPPVTSPELSPEDLRAIAAAFADGGRPTPRLLAFRGPVLVVMRRDGERLRQAWASGPSWWESLLAARDRARAEGATSAEVCLSYALTPHVGRLGSVHRGILGLEVNGERLAPTEMLARNLSFPKAAASLSSKPPRVSTFRAEQALVRLGNPPEAVRMVRGNQLVPLEEVTPERLERFRDELGGWLLANLHPNGRLTYKYWPSRGEEAPQDNPLRQFMATWALEEWRPGSAGANLEHNLRRFYRDGVIEYRGEVKLGAMAIAGLALLESGTHERELDALCATIESLARPDGSFRTFLRPKERENDNQNFYSGEAQLLRARLYARSPDEKARERFMKTFRYYREFFRRKPNPAFVPWHTRACATLHAARPDPELEAFVFEMNDWLLGEAHMQEWEESPYPDLQGRFYNSRRPDYGPPHASSTGAFLEGLCPAYQMALAAGDRERAERYRTAILRGARHLLQLQFADEVDMFYVSKRERVRGGLRTEVYDNEVRVDNVQHALSAVLAMLQGSMIQSLWPQGS